MAEAQATPVRECGPRADEESGEAVTEGGGDPLHPRPIILLYRPERERQANLNYPAAGQEPRRAVGLKGLTAT